VYIHYFFQSQSIVTDAEIMQKVSASLSRVTDYRRWYWSLMDVGAHLKSQQSGHLVKAKSYKKQSTFIGSRRQLRGRIVASLLTGPVGYQKLKNEFNDERFDDVLEALINEHMVAMQDGRVLIV
jgi:A/G-specific adenine glycosylase